MLTGGLPRARRHGHDHGAKVRIDHPESANDELTVNGLGGNDSFSIGSGLPSLIGVTVNQ